MAKREELLQGAAHFVEIDLLRGGRPMPLENRPECDSGTGQPRRGSSLGRVLAAPPSPGPP